MPLIKLEGLRNSFNLGLSLGLSHYFPTNFQSARADKKPPLATKSESISKAFARTIVSKGYVLLAREAQLCLVRISYAKSDRVFHIQSSCFESLRGKARELFLLAEPLIPSIDDWWLLESIRTDFTTLFDIGDEVIALRRQGKLDEAKFLLNGQFCRHYSNKLCLVLNHYALCSIEALDAMTNRQLSSDRSKSWLGYASFMTGFIASLGICFFSCRRVDSKLALFDRRVTSLAFDSLPAFLWIRSMMGLELSGRQAEILRI